jgi:hypothetical protein
MIMDGDGRAEICPIAIAAVSTLGKILYCEATPPDCMEDKCAWKPFYGLGCSDGLRQGWTGRSVL